MGFSGSGVMKGNFFDFETDWHSFRSIEPLFFIKKLPHVLHIYSLVGWSGFEKFPLLPELLILRFNPFSNQNQMIRFV